jgi:hypothetical protein
MSQNKPEGVQCGYCPKIIYKHNESGNKIWISKGKPICAVCRIMKHTKIANKIKKDFPKFEDAMKKKGELIQKAENERVLNVATLKHSKLLNKISI